MENTEDNEVCIGDILNMFTKIEINYNINNDINIKSKSKREQVKNACINCKIARKKCDVNRPCNRCVNADLSEMCKDSIRKKREKGIKRGPYKKKQL
jgi:hypothetical protein